MQSKTIILVIPLLILCLIIGFFVSREVREAHKMAIERPLEETPTDATVQEGKLNGNPTDFAQSGTITFKKPDPDMHGTPYFSYIEAGSVKATTTLVFDPMSFCVRSNGGIPCIAMSVTYDVPFNNKKAVIEGIRLSGDNEVLVRKLYILKPGEQARVPDAGQTFITWPQAENIIRSCGVTMVLQTHTLDVVLTVKDGTTLRTVAPMSDDVSRSVQESQTECGNIVQAME